MRGAALARALDAPLTAPLTLFSVCSSSKKSGCAAAATRPVPSRGHVGAWQGWPRWWCPNDFSGAACERAVLCVSEQRCVRACV